MSPPLSNVQFCEIRHLRCWYGPYQMDPLSPLFLQLLMPLMQLQPSLLVWAEDETDLGYRKTMNVRWGIPLHIAASYRSGAVFLREKRVLDRDEITAS